MKKLFLTAVAALCLALCYAEDATPTFTFEDAGEWNTLVRINEQKHYVLLPIEERAPELWVRVIYNNKQVDKICVRLAQNTVDYYVPYDLSAYDVRQLVLDVRQTDNRIWRREQHDWHKKICLSDTYDVTNVEKYRPAYHHTPAYGWMNDPNGMYYDPQTKLWHLYYQYNPYGSMWQNMTWGHSTSSDLLHWDYKGLAIVPNDLGTIFSGSCVIDHNNTAGFGADAVIALYTSAGEYQSQSLAYSTDGGMTFTPYARNPILVADLPDFRDPNMFWNEDTKEWNLVLACDQEMRFYTSPNLINWKYESAFGAGFGNHEGVWECPDLMKLKVEGTDQYKWVLLCNINPGGPFGGSATQYFVGDWDGHKFTCDDRVEKWLDYGRDHYATVSFSGAPEHRNVVMAWMSNWQYANDVPTYQYRSANSLPRDLYIYKGTDKNYYVGVRASSETQALRGKLISQKTVQASAKPVSLKMQMPSLIDVTVQNKSAEAFTLTMSNVRGEQVVMTYDMKEGAFTTNRTQGGNYKFSGAFGGTTLTPIVHKTGNSIHLQIFVDNCSVEVFGDDKWSQTNLIFPSVPFSRLAVSTDSGAASISIREYEAK